MTSLEENSLPQSPTSIENKQDQALSVPEEMVRPVIEQLIVKLRALGVVISDEQKKQATDAILQENRKKADITDTISATPQPDTVFSSTEPLSSNDTSVENPRKDVIEKKLTTEEKALKLQRLATLWKIEENHPKIKDLVEREMMTGPQLEEFIMEKETEDGLSADMRELIGNTKWDAATGEMLIGKGIVFKAIKDLSSMSFVYRAYRDLGNGLLDPMDVCMKAFGGKGINADKASKFGLLERMYSEDMYGEGLAGRHVSIYPLRGDEKLVFQVRDSIGSQKNFPEAGCLLMPFYDKTLSDFFFEEGNEKIKTLKEQGAKSTDKLISNYHFLPTTSESCAKLAKYLLGFLKEQSEFAINGLVDPDRKTNDLFVHEGKVIQIDNQFFSSASSDALKPNLATTFRILDLLSTGYEVFKPSNVSENALEMYIIGQNQEESEDKLEWQQWSKIYGLYALSKYSNEEVLKALSPKATYPNSNYSIYIAELAKPPDTVITVDVRAKAEKAPLDSKLTTLAWEMDINPKIVELSSKFFELQMSYDELVEQIKEIDHTQILALLTRLHDLEKKKAIESNPVTPAIVAPSTPTSEPNVAPLVTSEVKQNSQRLPLEDERVAVRVLKIKYSQGGNPRATDKDIVAWAKAQGISGIDQSVIETLDPLNDSLKHGLSDMIAPNTLNPYTELLEDASRNKNIQDITLEDIKPEYASILIMMTRRYLEGEGNTINPEKFTNLKDKNFAFLEQLGKLAKQAGEKGTNTSIASILTSDNPRF